MRRSLLILILFGLTAQLCMAKVITVDTSGSGDFQTIQAGIDAAATGDTVLVLPGTYLENINFLGKNIYLTSQDGPAVTTIDGSQPVNADVASVVTFDSGEDSSAVLHGFTITGGEGTLIQTPFPFGAIKVGGGIHCDNSSPTIEGNFITDNLAEDGGGMEVNHQSFATVKNNVFWKNQVSSTKQGFFPSGGAIGVANGAQPNIINNTIVLNVARAPVTSGGGVSALFGGTVANLRNNIVVNNHGAGIFAVQGGQVNTSYSNVWQNTPDYLGADCSNGCITLNPLFVDADSGDFRLQSNSPCIDAGDPNETDPDGSRRDMGAFFYDQSATSVETSENKPSEYVLWQNYPNPFNPETEIRFQLPAASQVVVTIHNVLGQKILTLTDRRYPEGHHRIHWQGRNHQGNQVGSGIYLYKLHAGDFTQVKKMTLLR